MKHCCKVFFDAEVLVIIAKILGICNADKNAKFKPSRIEHPKFGLCACRSAVVNGKSLKSGKKYGLDDQAALRAHSVYLF